jgi:hypothetical protein
VWNLYVEPPSTEPPSTEPPSTEPPSTEPPSTEPPLTEPPLTSLRAVATGVIDEMLSKAGEYAIEKANIYTVQNYTDLIFERNPNVWCAEMDFTGCSPWNSHDGPRRAGTLVTPRHVLFSTHYGIPINSTIIFVTSANEVISRTVIATTIAHNDISVGMLDSDVPSSIKHYKVLPTDYRKYATPGVPVIEFTQRETALLAIYEGTTISTYDYGLVYFSCYGIPFNPAQQLWYNTIIIGDSGNPTFFYIDGEEILASLFYYPFAGVSVGIHADKINEAISRLGSTYTVEQKSLSAYYVFQTVFNDA